MSSLTLPARPCAATQALSLFVHRASECLTDHESHGDGLICFALLNGLAARGHDVFAYANTAPIRNSSPRLRVKTERHRSPANSLAPWEYSWRAERWLQETLGRERIDLVWRMHPYGPGCPYPPQTCGRPLVIGPLFREWPEALARKHRSAHPRYGIGLERIVQPLAARGWERALRRASLLLCATPALTAEMQARYPQAMVRCLPVIVDAPEDAPRRRQAREDGRLRLVFVANLVPNKNPQLFCELIGHLRRDGIPAEGIVLGDGPERPALDAWRDAQGLQDALVFQGSVPHQEVHGFLRDADFLVSASDFEAYGRTIAEAMAVGTPCVCSALSGGPADIVADGEDGLLIPRLDARAYADAIGRAHADPAAWQQLSASALQKAQSWTGEAVLSRLETWLHEITSCQNRSLPCCGRGSGRRSVGDTLRGHAMS
ncbi:MAG TPA: glycosyltransferase [Chthonomonadaceae bacterium]|nr:glycosyltransferase [Chthonomonadaceae bacterium]